MSVAKELEHLLGPAGSMPSTTPIQKIRTPHHELARLLAMGLKDVEVSRATGYSQSRICILKQDPMFRELLAHYSANRDAAAADMSQRLQALSLSAVEELLERLDDPEVMADVSMKDLRQIAEMGLDRTGYGKTTKLESSTTVRIQTLAEIKATIEREHRGRVLPRSERPDQGDCIELAPGEYSEGEKADGGES